MTALLLHKRCTGRHHRSLTGLGFDFRLNAFKVTLSSIAAPS